MRKKLKVCRYLIFQSSTSYIDLFQLYVLRHPTPVTNGGIVVLQIMIYNSITWGLMLTDLIMLTPTKALYENTGLETRFSLFVVVAIVETSWIFLSLAKESLGLEAPWRGL